MPKFTLNKRSLTTALLVVAAGLPAAAQARPAVGPGPVKDVNLSAPARVNGPVQGPGATPTQGPAPGASAESGFQWGDAGIGAGGALVVLGGGAAAYGITRRRRGHRPVTG